MLRNATVLPRKCTAGNTAVLFRTINGGRIDPETDRFSLLYDA